MQIDLIVMGNIKNKNIQAVCDEYSKRLSKFCKLNIIELKDERNDNDNVLVKEAQRISKVLDTNSYIIILDVAAKQITSEEFSEKIKNISIYEKGKITFIIGGSLGIDDSIKNMANYRMSFSKMTFPHQLFRAIFLEQLYRQYKISANEPYHK